ncbi:MAG TPA: hypothetical protein VHM26_05370, partial [Chitinophagaceae bacterium]|nr:hypothetical protein [Chitinophagaceae bacterium]
MKKLVLSVLSLGLFLTATAQNYWSARTDGRNITTDKAVARLSFPNQFKLYDVNESPLRQQLFSVAGNTTNHSTIISLPNAD